MDLFAALAVAVLPFMIPDAIKLVIGAQLGHSVRRATSTRTASA